ncbi:MAG: HAD family hydrolase [Nitrospiraceae bacterium]|nr:HAD family hydrolase [Nitrospiraceae bacterium]
MPPLSTSRTMHTSQMTDIAALFDVDNTLLPGQASEVRFFRFLWRRGLVGWRELRESTGWLLRRVPPLSLQPLRERKLYLAGKPVADIVPLADEFCRGEIFPRIAAEGLARMDEHRRAGHRIVLVTGSLDFLIAPLARWLGVETVLAASPEQEHCRFTGNLLAPYPYGPGKRELITAWVRGSNIDLSRSFAYGDSPGDVELLRMVGNPLVVNPIRGMGRIARQQGWTTVRWR